VVFADDSLIPEIRAEKLWAVSGGAEIEVYAREKNHDNRAEEGDPGLAYPRKHEPIEVPVPCTCDKWPFAHYHGKTKYSTPK